MTHDLVLMLEWMQTKRAAGHASMMRSLMRDILDEAESSIEECVSDYNPSDRG